MRPWSWLRGTLGEWSWAHTGLGLLLGTLALFNLGGLLLNLNSGMNVPRAWVYNVCEFGLPGVLALRMADRAVADGVPRLLAYGLAPVLVIVSGVWVIGPLMFPLIGGDPGWDSRQDVILAFNLLLPMGVGTLAYAHWRRAADTLQRLQAAELARAQQEQLVQSARLLALQARVEPQLLFDTLARVRDGIQDSAEAADRLLADLIALLRALQPAVGATASTVERELGLVQAYARVSGTAALQRPQLHLHASALARPARLAPLLLLPVLRALTSPPARGPWQLWASAAGPRLQLSLQPPAGDAAALAALQALDLAPLHDRLRAVHGPDAHLTRATDTAPQLLIDLPLEHEPHPSPDR